MDIVPRGLIPMVQARPFNISFNRQRNTAVGMFGSHLVIHRFRREEIMAQLTPLLDFYPQRDQGLIADRVCESILFRQKQ